jgi:hypothetical protein
MGGGNAGAFVKQRLDLRIYRHRRGLLRRCVELSAATLALDLHTGEKRLHRLGTYREGSADVEFYRCFALRRRQAKAIGVALGIGKKDGAACLILRGAGPRR